MMNRSLRRIMSVLGLTAKHALVFEHLSKGGVVTPLSVARETKLNRSSIYRYLEELSKHGLIEELMSGKTRKYIATTPEGLNLALTREEAKLTTLKEEIPVVIAQMKELRSDEITQTQIRHYKGRSGLQQLLWNVVSSGEEFVGFGYQDWNTSVGKKYAEMLREQIISSNIKSRELLNEVDDSYIYTGLGSKYKQVYEHRAIPAEILRIKYDTYIYGDVFAYYYHYGNELFGVEIHNKEIAETERQIFEILWERASNPTRSDLAGVPDKI